MKRDFAVPCLLVAGILSACAEPIPAQQGLPLDSLFVAHRRPASFAGDSASGPGWDFLVEQAATAQFVMVGESHYVREIPLFTSQLFRALHDRAGFQYLALEDGPWATGMLMGAGVRGDRDATFAMATRYRNALQFFNDQDVDLIVTAGRTSTSTGAPVWGLDQTWGALHVLERLGQLVPAGERAAAVGRLVDRARVVEAYRPEEDKPRFLTDSLTSSDLVALRGAAGGISPEADRLLDMLQTSFEIYSSRTDGPAIYRSNDRRERYMKARFVDEYEAARVRGDSLPRVLLKFGQWHAIRGVLNWGSVQSLGTFVSEFAHGHRMESLHIWTGLVDEPGRYWTLSDSPDYVSLAKAGSTDRWWIIDLRPIRPLVAAGKVTGMNEEMRKVVFGFDLALLIGNGNRATYDHLIESARR
jgi:hypothetical protein